MDATDATATADAAAAAFGEALLRCAGTPHAVRDAADAAPGHGRANALAAASHLAGPELARLGGSREQRDLYALAELEAAEAAGATRHARALLKRRIAERPEVAWHHRRLAALEAAAAPRYRAA